MCINSRLMCEIYSKIIVEPSDVVMSLLLTLNVFVFLAVLVFFADFEHVSAGWNTLLPYSEFICAF